MSQPPMKHQNGFDLLQVCAVCNQKLSTLSPHVERFDHQQAQKMFFHIDCYNSVLAGFDDNLDHSQTRIQ